jgi:hypothetical protein
MRGRLAAAARQQVVGLYNLPISTSLECQIQVASLLHNYSWIGIWNDQNDEQKGVKWYTRPEIPRFIYHFFYATPQSLGRQSYLADMYVNRVTPPMLALVATALNLALREWAKGSKQSPALEFKRELFMCTYSCRTPHLKFH